MGSNRVSVTMDSKGLFDKLSGKSLDISGLIYSEIYI
jgi:hypothetical protein